MFNIRKTFGLTEDGYKDFKRAVFSIVLSNLYMFLPFVILIQTIITILDPLMSGGSLSVMRLWILFTVGVFAAVLYFFAYRNEYRKTYTVAYSESEKIRLEVAEHLRRLPLSFFNKKDLSELTTNMMDDCTAIEHNMSHVAPGLLANFITVVLISSVLTVYDYRMSIALFAALPIAFGSIFLSRKFQAKFGEKKVKAKLNASKEVQEYLEGIKVIKAFGLSSEKSESLKKSFSDLRVESMKFEGFVGMFVILAMTILQVGICLVVLIGTILLTDGEISPIKFLTFIVISARIYAPFIVLLTLVPEFFYSLVSMRRMQELRQEKTMTGDKNTELKNYNIKLKNVVFSYGDENVIKNINLNIPQDGVTAFVGPSGSGKTTISRLIARFWDVKSGEILIGDGSSSNSKNISQIDPEHLMNYMSFVFQDVVLFNDSIMNNIRIGRKNASDEEVFNAAKISHADEFIRKMPNGYDSLLSENGKTLSSGERQRISIARAILKNAPIVILDEWAASLDPENEIQIKEAISKLISGRTVIVIAHRLRSIINADKIAVFDKGKLVEEGSSDELIAENGIFAKLYKIQENSRGWTVSS
jgi:ATP-binding cassette subfamily B protein